VKAEDILNDSQAVASEDLHCGGFDLEL